MLVQDFGNLFLDDVRVTHPDTVSIENHSQVLDTLGKTLNYDHSLKLIYSNKIFIKIVSFHMDINIYTKFFFPKNDYIKVPLSSG